MTEPDDELRRLLKQWEAPSPGAKLDARVWASCWHPKKSLRWKWLPVAAALLLAAGAARFWPTHAEASLETRLDAAGYSPMANGAITVVKTGVKP